MEEFLNEFAETPGYQEQMAEPRVLRARWTQELYDDLLHVHGINLKEVFKEDHFKEEEELFKI